MKKFAVLAPAVISLITLDLGKILPAIYLMLWSVVFGLFLVVETWQKK